MNRTDLPDMNFTGLGFAIRLAEIKTKSGAWYRRMWWGLRLAILRARRI